MNRTKIVRFHVTPTEADLAALRAKGLEIVHVSRLEPDVTVRLPVEDEDAIRVLADEILAMETVADVEDDFEVRATLVDVAPLVRVAELWALPKRVRFGATVLDDHVLDGGNQGAGIRVAVLDTGLDLDYPDFQGRIVGKKDYTGKGSVTDGHGHGTHVAGCVGMSGLADSRYVGMAPACSFLIYKVLGDNGSGSAANIAAALEQALTDGADIVSMSLGGEAPGAAPDFLERRTDAVAARIPVFVAAGNAGPATPFRQTPARAAAAITVGASTKQDGIASFSSRGDTDDGRIKPNVYAPGHQIGAARAKDTTMGTPVNAVVTSASGTSMATPAAAGLAACLLSLDPTLKGKPSTIKALFMDRGQVIAPEARRAVAPDLAMAPIGTGSDRLRTPAPAPSPVPSPPPTPPSPPQPEPPASPCEDLFDEVLADPNLRRRFLRRAVPAVLRELRRAGTRRE